MTSTAEALLTAINNAPDDLTARLVYADYLRESVPPLPHHADAWAWTAEKGYVPVKGEALVDLGYRTRMNYLNRPGEEGWFWLTPGPPGVHSFSTMPIPPVMVAALVEIEIPQPDYETATHVSANYYTSALEALNALVSQKARALADPRKSVIEHGHTRLYVARCFGEKPSEDQPGSKHSREGRKRAIGWACYWGSVNGSRRVSDVFKQRWEAEAWGREHYRVGVWGKEGSAPYRLRYAYPPGVAPPAWDGGISAPMRRGGR